MAILKVRIWGDPILKTRAKAVGQVTDEVRCLVRDMTETLHAESGLGLAANQVGVSERVFVAEVPMKVGPAKTYAFINPEITYQSRVRESREEGCLSFPGIFGEVERSVEVEIRGTDPNGHALVLRERGLLARAIQHEMDHLDGIVFIERMSMVHRLLLKRQLKELAKAKLG